MGHFWPFAERLNDQSFEGSCSELNNCDEKNMRLPKSEDFDDFKPEELQGGSKQVYYLHVSTLTGGDLLRIAVLVAKGAKPGPTIVALGGVHGDEYEGPYAVRELYRHLDPVEMKGTFIGVPHCNVPAFAKGTRTSPIDGLNLARIMPGKVDGTITERIAHYLATHIIDRGDFVIDLHSSGMRWNMASLIGYYEGGDDLSRRSCEAAFAFGMPVLWGHPSVSPGRTVSRAHERGIPWLYTESPGGGWLNVGEAGRYARRVKNVMKLMGILDGEIEKQEPTHHLLGDGNVDVAPVTNVGGYLVPEVELLEQVAEGDLLGRVVGLAGEVRDEIVAKQDGVVILIRATPSISAGEAAFLVTGQYPG